MDLVSDSTSISTTKLPPNKQDSSISKARQLSSLEQPADSASPSPKYSREQIATLPFSTLALAPPKQCRSSKHNIITT